MQNNSKLVAVGLSVALFAGIGVQIGGKDPSESKHSTKVSKTSWYRPWTKVAQAARWARTTVSNPIRKKLENQFPRATEIIKKIDNKLNAIPLYGFFWKRIPYEAKVIIVGNIIAAVTVISYKKGRKLYGKYTQPRVTKVPLKDSTKSQPVDANTKTKQPPMTKKQLIVKGIQSLGIDKSEMSKEYKRYGTKFATSLNKAIANIKNPDNNQALYDKLQALAMEQLTYMGEQKKEKYNYNHENANKTYTRLIATADVIEKSYPDIANFIRENLRRYITQVETQKNEMGKWSW